MARDQRDRHTPLPGLLELPGWLLAKLTRRQQIALAAAAAVALAAGGVGLAALIRTGDRQASEQRVLDARRAAARERDLREDQRPRTAVLAPGATSAAADAPRKALERAITRDVRARVRAGKLDGPVAGTACAAIPGAKRASAAYNCFTLSQTRRANYTIESGYRFSARADLARRTLTWCKRNPRPIHPDTGYFRTAPVSRACLPRG